MLVEQQGSIVVLLIYDVPIYYILPVQKRLPLTLWSLWSRDLGNGLALSTFVKYVKAHIQYWKALESGISNSTSLDFFELKLSNILNDWKIDFFLLQSKSQESQVFQVSSSNVLWGLLQLVFKLVCIGMRLHFLCSKRILPWDT